jgi:diacylglycerol kinase (ATP)
VKACAILNPEAGSAGQSGLFDELDALELDWWVTDEAGDAKELATIAARDDYERVIVLGGDGTIHEVVNGLMTVDTPPTLAVVPVGTGNDLARTLALPDDPLEALALVPDGKARPLDLIHVRPDDESPRYAINAAAGGFSGQVDEQLSSDMKQAWGPLAFLLGAVNALPEMEDYVTRIAFEDQEAEVVEAFNVIVANGRMVGGGKLVAPVANPEDGLLDVVTVQAGSVLELSQVAAQLVTGNYLSHELVHHRQVASVRLAASPGMWFNVDGELLTKEPVTFEVVPQALRVLVGPEYQATPDE